MIALSCALFVGMDASASESVKPVPLQKKHYLLSEDEPFVPRDSDYSLELGAMAEQRSLYWAAGHFGRHVGRCFLTDSQTCQQYLDFLVGFAGRDSETYTHLWTSVRWQFVNFPRSWSPLLRVFGGAVRAQVPSETEWRGISGMGLGVTTFLHDKVDLRFEMRAGFSKHVMSQGVFAVQIKTDRLLEYFAKKMAEFGVLGLTTAIEGVSAPFMEPKQPSPSESTPEK
ncbi:MAG: hypothetical protein NDI61_07635 [Bdellovibrionaceae bacterium]|nr:hypothetical protein [Pseudobdellovibrionaceae bacterium]